ncbi:hypothetical protein I302_103852 [Kwoniella bestiolae CBS 10118]|uniref:Uncharacterized protein n=1 Tax=Kwoniella bestiolae CBS 10118 TaxID=1296100 RepID=A0A1B9G9Q6_9TREE|nr:hypothetical protein I302_02555 [Kwoniella bestiolae CBS 10118]OCF27710.1 hypothetical protein I302_02555 [Kwoniella bestiolae CBS 10118]
MNDTIPSSGIGRWPVDKPKGRHDISPYNLNPLSRRLGSGLVPHPTVSSSSTLPRRVPTSPLDSLDKNLSYLSSPNSPTPSKATIPLLFKSSKVVQNENDIPILKKPLKRRAPKNLKTDTIPTKQPRYEEPPMPRCSLEGGPSVNTVDTSLVMAHPSSSSKVLLSSEPINVEQVEKHHPKAPTDEKLKLQMRLCELEYEYEATITLVFPNTPETLSSRCFACQSLLVECSGQNCKRCERRNELCVPVPVNLAQCSTLERSNINEYVCLLQLKFKLDNPQHHSS